MSNYNDSKLGDFDTEEDAGSGSSSRQLHSADDFPIVDGEDGPDAAAADTARRYSVRELVRTLGGHNTESLSPELERRVLDFRLAQTKRRELYGEQKRWGIFGLYAHLSNLRVDLEWAEDAAWRRQNHKPYLSWSDFNAARLSGRNRPYFTYFLIAFCSIMLLVEFGVNDWKVEPISVNPMVGPSAETLVKLGARDTPKIVEQGQWYRIFTPLVLHAGIIHYIINMVALWFVGGAIEQSHGIFDTALLFSLPGVGGNILGAIFLPQYVSVGASGGIFGLMGGCIADMLMNWHLLFLKNSPDEADRNMYRRNFWAVTFLVGEISINIILGLVTPFIDNWSHLGGIFYGACSAFSAIYAMPVGFFGVDTSNTTWAKIRTFLIKFSGLIVTIVLIFSSTVWLAKSEPGEIPCEGCRYISCVPFPFFQEDKWWYCDDCDGTSAKLFLENDVYVSMDLNCPDKSIEQIDVSNLQLTDQKEVQKLLPKYCREYCDSVFT